MALSYEPHYWEDYEIDQKFESPGRTITDADLAIHAAFSGDWTEVHTNEEYAKGTKFGGRVAHGPLTFLVGTGLIVRMGIFERTVRAFLGMNYMEVTEPVFAGDTLYLTLEVKDKQRLESRDDEALVVFECEMTNQDDDVVFKGDLKFLMGLREATS
jgi:acyl dehydratase